MIKRLFSHTIIYGLAPQLTKIVGILILPILTKYLTPNDYAVAGLMATYLLMFGALQSLGLNIVIGNSFYKYNSNNRYKYIWRQILGFLYLYSIPFGIFLALFFYFVIPDVAQDNKMEIILTNVVPLVIFGPTQLMVFRYYQKMERPRPIALRSLLIGSVTIALNLLFIAHYKLGYMGWFYANAIASTIAFITFFYPFFIKNKFAPIFNFHWKSIKGYLKVSLPALPHYYSAYLLNSSDRAVMDITSVSMKGIGLYSFAYNFGNYFESVSTAFANAIGPMYLKGYQYKSSIEGGLYAKSLTDIVMVVFLTMTFTISLWSKEIFYLLVNNEELRSVYPLSIIIIMAYNYKPIYFFVFTKINFFEKTKDLWKISFAAGIFNLLFNFILIPKYGYEMAAYTTYISLMYMGYSGFFLKSFKEINSVKIRPFFWLILTVVLTAAAYYLVEQSIYIKIGVSLLLLCIATMVVLRMKKNVDE